ncbi:uncharacterized protein C20orf85 homolog isoform X1 [Canis lupus dingo]|uniref:uncharacterized protein C20orf85 homolog isoform X1 n=1 Tax=Canis lupus dingo TaxID=286419 RepID=UPI0020C1DE7F|nr:uncharacterized protein C20orf85 homolog isoform X1 [Canis lupus dingo]
MAQKPLSTAAAQRMNLVAQDEIWKYRLKAEGEARQNWAQNWGFLTTPVEELLKGEEEPPTLKPKIELPQRFRIRPVTPVEKYIKDLQCTAQVRSHPTENTTGPGAASLPAWILTPGDGLPRTYLCKPPPPTRWTHVVESFPAFGKLLGWDQR